VRKLESFVSVRSSTLEYSTFPSATARRHHASDLSIQSSRPHTHRWSSAGVSPIRRPVMDGAAKPSSACVVAGWISLVLRHYSTTMERDRQLLRLFCWRGRWEFWSTHWWFVASSDRPGLTLLPNGQTDKHGWSIDQAGRSGLT